MSVEGGGEGQRKEEEGIFCLYFVYVPSLEVGGVKVIIKSSLTLPCTLTHPQADTNSVAIATTNGCNVF